MPAVRIGPWLRLEPASANRYLMAPVLSRAEYFQLAGGGKRFTAFARQSQVTPPPRVVFFAILVTWLSGILILACRLLVGRGRLRKMSGVGFR